MSNNFYRFHNPPVKPLNYEQFWDTKLFQDFSLPNPLINYIIFNPLYPNVYQKLLESCKYFYEKKKILLIQNSYHYVSTKWSFRHIRRSKIILWATTDFGKNGFDVTKLDGKLWLLKNLYLTSTNPINAASLLYPKIYRCDVKLLVISKQRLALKELKVLASNAEKCVFQKVTVTDDENEDIKIQFERILQNIPKLTNLKCDFDLDLQTMSLHKINKFSDIPHLQNLEELYLENAPELFDIKSFVEYLRENNCWYKACIIFSRNISWAYKNQLSEVIDDILKNKKTLNFVPPRIYFYGHDRTKDSNLCKLQQSMLKKMPPKIHGPISNDIEQQQHLHPQHNVNRFFKFISSNITEICFGTLFFALFVVMFLFVFVFVFNN